MVRLGAHCSLWTGSWTREAAETAIPEAAKYGLQVIEIALLNPDAVDVPHSKALFAAHGVAPTCSLGLPGHAIAPLDPQAATRFLEKVVDTAAALGARVVTGVTYSGIGYKTGKPPQEAEYAAIASALRPIARRCADQGITLGLEPCNRYETHLVNTGAQALSLIERIGEPNVMLHFDTYHMNIEEKGFAGPIEQAGHALQYIHLSESDRGVPGTGTVDWGQIFQALAAIGFQGDLVLESFIVTPPEIVEALCIWRPVAKNREEVLDRGLSYLRDKAVASGVIAANS